MNEIHALNETIAKQQEIISTLTQLSHEQTQMIKQYQLITRHQFKIIKESLGITLDVTPIRSEQ